MRSVTPYKFFITSSTAASSISIAVYGKSFLELRNVYLSASNIEMFSGITLFNPFSGQSAKIKTMYPAFSAIQVSEFTVEADQILTFTFPQTPQTSGYIDIIAENEAGYGKLTTDTRMPFISSYQEAEDIQNPWINGLIINKS